MSVNAESRFIFVETRNGLYRSQCASEQADVDALIEDSCKAILCFDLADLITQGVGLYESINNLDNDWRGLIYAGVVQYQALFEKRIEKLYRDWLEVSNSVVNCYEVLEGDFVSRGFDTESIHVLRKGIREVRAMFLSDSEFFNHQKLVDLRDKAIDECRCGNAHSA